ncbi:hypothetical protein PLESTF_001681400 [Pleodorina starrii]|nr:hypothetical protein PLESTF_001681400 [Pleodorina starrii]
MAGTGGQGRASGYDGSGGGDGNWWWEQAWQRLGDTVEARAAARGGGGMVGRRRRSRRRRRLIKRRKGPQVQAGETDSDSYAWGCVAQRMGCSYGDVRGGRTEVLRPAGGAAGSRVVG